MKPFILKSFTVQVPGDYSQETIIDSMLEKMNKGEKRNAPQLLQDGPIISRFIPPPTFWDFPDFRQEKFPKETHALEKGAAYSVEFIQFLEEDGAFTINDVFKYLQENSYLLLGAQTLAFLWENYRNMLPVKVPWLMAVDTEENQYLSEENGRVGPTIIIGKNNENCLGTYSVDVPVKRKNAYIWSYVGIKKIDS